MNKGRRDELTKLKYKKRLKQLGLKEEDSGKKGWNYHCYKTTGSPCSCEACSGERYNRTQKHKNHYLDEVDDLEEIVHQERDNEYLELIDLMETEDENKEVKN